MKAADFKIFLFSHQRAVKINDFEKNKINELIATLNENCLENLALNIATDKHKRLDRSFLNLNILLSFLRDEFESEAIYKAQRTRLKGANLSNYEKEKILFAFFFKKSLTPLPQWAKEKMLESETQK